MKALLRIISGTKEKGAIDLETGSYSIGREDGVEIKVDSRQVSRKHAQITIDKNHVRLVDCDSANGTFVNGKPFSSGPLYEGDRIQIGDILFEYHTKRQAQLTALAGNSSDPLTIRKTTTRKTLGGAKKSEIHLKWVFSGFMAFTLCSFVLVAGTSLRSTLKARLEQEAMKHGEQTVRYLAEKNRENLRLGNELLLDIEGVSKEKGVKEATIINAKSRIIAPVGRMGQIESDPFTSEALQQNSERSLLPSPALADGSFIFVHPIRAYNDKSGGYETLGVAKIVFSPTEYVGSLAEIQRLLFALLALALVLSASATWLFWKKMIPALHKSFEERLK